MLLFNQKKLLLFGTGSVAEQLLDLLNTHQMAPAYAIDNNAAKWHSQLRGLPVCPPAVLQQEDWQHCLVLIGSSFYEEISRQLQSMGLQEHQHFISGAVASRYLQSKQTAAGRHPQSFAPFGIFNIELTNKCPLKCVMCARTHGMTRPQGFMDFDLFRQVIDELCAQIPPGSPAPEVWQHHFGESLLHPEFDMFIRYAAQRGIRPALSLNPVMLTDDISERLLDAGPSRLYMSLDGHDDQSFFEIRGLRHAYEKSRQQLLQFLQRKIAREAPVIVVLSMINFSKNHRSIRQLTEFWQQTPGIDEFMAKAFVNWNGDLSAVNQLQQDTALQAQDHVVCNIPWQTMTIAWDGDVVPCCYDYDKKLVLGNVRQQSLQQIWQGESMQQLRREFISNKVNNPLCRQCPTLRDIKA